MARGPNSLGFRKVGGANLIITLLTIDDGRGVGAGFTFFLLLLLLLLFLRRRATSSVIGILYTNPLETWQQQILMGFTFDKDAKCNCLPVGGGGDNLPMASKINLPNGLESFRHFDK